MSMYLKAIAISVMLPAMAAAQTDDTVFDPANAILDTKIPFAIGAHEGQQSLRASFGWPTFQEGLVMGVYYRFDPDGYARFATSPRLDTDVFEVMCRARTHVCAARKGPLTFRLTDNGQVHMLVDGLVAGTQISASDGTNVFPLPDSILQPMSPALENALSAARELIISQDQQASQNIRLDGLAAVLAYLRWVVAGQDYSVLPSNWPIPADARLPQPQQNAPANWRQGQQDSPLAAFLESADSNAFASTDNAQFEPRVTPPVPSQILPVAQPTAPSADPALVAAISRMERTLERMQQQLANRDRGTQNDLVAQMRRLAVQLDVLQSRIARVETRVESLPAATSAPPVLGEPAPSAATTQSGAQPEPSVASTGLSEIDEVARQRLLRILGVVSEPSALQESMAEQEVAPVATTVIAPQDVTEANVASREQQLLNELEALRGENSGPQHQTPPTTPVGSTQPPAQTGLVAPDQSGSPADTVVLERELVEAILDELSAEATTSIAVPTTSANGNGVSEPAEAAAPSSDGDDGFKSLTDYLREISPAD